MTALSSTIWRVLCDAPQTLENIVKLISPEIHRAYTDLRTRGIFGETYNTVFYVNILSAAYVITFVLYNQCWQLFACVEGTVICKTVDSVEKCIDWLKKREIWLTIMWRETGSLFDLFLEAVCTKATFPMLLFVRHLRDGALLLFMHLHKHLNIKQGQRRN